VTRRYGPERKCGLCKIGETNGTGIRVRRLSLIYSGLPRKEWIGHVQLCDPCLREIGLQRGKRWLRDACKRGHRRTPENTYITPQGARQCRVCRDERRVGRALGRWIEPRSAA
jgi:hypothetical protein